MITKATEPENNNRITPKDLPCLCISNDKKIIVFAFEHSNEDEFIGVVIHVEGTSPPKIGEYSDEWLYDYFSMYQGKIELSNN